MKVEDPTESTGSRSRPLKLSEQKVQWRLVDVFIVLEAHQKDAIKGIVITLWNEFEDLARSKARSRQVGLLMTRFWVHQRGTSVERSEKKFFCKFAEFPLFTALVKWRHKNATLQSLKSSPGQNVNDGRKMRQNFSNFCLYDDCEVESLFWVLL